MVSRKTQLSTLLIIFVILILVFSVQACAPLTPELVNSLPPWCAGSGDEHKLLPDLGLNKEEITYVEVCVPNGAGKFSIEPRDLTDDQRATALKTEGPFVISNILASFEILEKDTGKVVTKFESGLEIRVTYSGNTWNAIKKRGFEGPLVAYLVIKDERLGDTWIGFDERDLQIFYPGSEGYLSGSGGLIIKIDELPDPLIGGC